MPNARAFEAGNRERALAAMHSDVLRDEPLCRFYLPVLETLLSAITHTAEFP